MGIHLFIIPAGKETRGPLRPTTNKRLYGWPNHTNFISLRTKVDSEGTWCVATWARMKFTEHRSMVIRNVKVTSRFQLWTQGEAIPSVEESPINCLRRWYYASLSDRSNVSQIEKWADDKDEELKKIKGSGLPGSFPAWHPTTSDKHTQTGNERGLCRKWIEKRVLRTYWQGSRLPLAREDTDGRMTRSWLKSWSRKDRKSISPI